MKITRDGKYQTRAGNRVRILCTDLHSCDGTPVVGIVTDESGCEHVWVWEADGRSSIAQEKDRQYTWDLVPVAEKREGWIIVFPAHSAYNHMLTLGPIYNSREEAQKVADRRPDLKPFVAHIMWEQ